MISGEFKNRKNDLIKVQIDTAYSYEIGSSDLIRFSADEAVVIEQDCEDSFTHIIKSECTLNLIVSRFIQELYIDNDRELSMRVYKNNSLIYSGYVQPFTYNQNYAEAYTALEVKAFDLLGTLSEHRYKESISYDILKENSDAVTFQSIIYSIFGNENVYYDNSISIAPGSGNIFTDLGISESLLLGSEEPDVWKEEDILKEILQFFNLHIIQISGNFFIFSWGSKKVGGQINWLKINGSSPDVLISNISSLPVTSADISNSDTNISLSEVYKSFIVKDTLENNDVIFNSPLSSDNLISPYTNKQYYCREYLHSDASKKTDWYIQYMTNTQWLLQGLIGGSVSNINNFVSHDETGVATYQGSVADILGANPLVPIFLSLGKADIPTITNNSVARKVSMNNYLIISVNGSQSSNSDQSISKWNNIIDNTGGIIKYISANSVGSITPPDSGSTNYILFSGNIFLQSAGITRTWTEEVIVRDENEPDGERIDYIEHAGYIDINFAQLKYPQDSKSGLFESDTNILPPLEYEGLKNIINSNYGDKFEYKNSYGIDFLDKVPILCCQLKIGDKYCVETALDVYEWLTQAQCDSRSLENTFSLGINPKIGDKLLNNSFDIASNRDIPIEDEGTAIPIKSTDNLSGKIEFTILSPDYCCWTSYQKKHSTLFRHSKIYISEIPLMEYVKNIFIKNFECKIVSNNGNANNIQEKDLVYYIETTNNSIKKKEDITFKLNTALTSTEAISKGLYPRYYLSNIINLVDNTALLSVYSKYSSYENKLKKAEEHYINDYYDEFSIPRLIVESTLNDGIDYWKNYVFNYFPEKIFKVVSWKYNLLEGTKTAKFKEL